MSRNGSGTYSLPAGNPVVSGTTITTTWANSTLNDIASALTGSVAADGQTPMSGALNMASNKITSVTDPTSAQDAATKAYVDAATSGLSSTYLTKANNLSDVASASTSRTNLGLGTIATQAANSVAVTGGAIDGTTIGSTTRSTVKATTLDLGLASQSVAIGQGDASIMKNRIINGSMGIDQRNAGASYSTSTLASANFYCLDRYLVTGTQNNKFTIQQNAGSVTPPAGFNNYLGVTSSSAYSIASGDLFAIIQRIEAFNTADLGWGTANAKTVTLSFQVYSSLTGTFGGSLRNNNNNRSYPYSYTVSSSNTWTPISITIAGDTSGTWEGATNNAGIQVGFSLGTGSTYSGTSGAWAGANYYAPTGAVSVVGTSGATWYITGVQLEVGSSATGYEYRQYGQELALCQRYFEYASYNMVQNGTVYPSGTFKVDKRATPTCTITTQSSGSGGVIAANSYTGTGGFTLDTYNSTFAQAKFSASAEL